MQFISEASPEKLRGGYYTPLPVADFILKWGLTGLPCRDILEPSCGDGAFLKSLKKRRWAFDNLVGIEYNETESIKAQKVGLTNTSVLNLDFHRYCLDSDKRFDLVVGNPPYIRYQYYEEDQQLLAQEIFAKSGLKFSKLTNAWVTFVVGSCQLLKEKGRLGFVVPAELLQVSYAKQLREYLASFFNEIIIVTFEHLVFEGIQQEVVLLLCEKKGTKKHRISHFEVKDAEALNSLDIKAGLRNAKSFDFKSDKWTYYFLTQEEIDFLQKAKSSIPTMGKFATVEVGITTGANKFFTVPQSVVDDYELQAYAKPMIGRSVQVNSAIFSKNDWKKNNQSGVRSNLLVFTPNLLDNANNRTKDYICYGEEQELHKWYKNSIRDEWYIIPSIRLSDALFLRRSNLYPKLVLNKAKAYTTDTMHRVFIKKDINEAALVASYYNSLTLASIEVSGRSHGGGVLELMPNEVESVLLPYSESNESLLKQIDSMLRKGTGISKILDVTDKIILQNGAGFSEQEVLMARRIWEKLTRRRLTRKED